MEIYTIDTFLNKKHERCKSLITFVSLLYQAAGMEADLDRVVPKIGKCDRGCVEIAD
jgi:hypothetical protein